MANAALGGDQNGVILESACRCGSGSAELTVAHDERHVRAVIDLQHGTGVFVRAGRCLGIAREELLR